MSSSDTATPCGTIHRDGVTEYWDDCPNGQSFIGNAWDWLIVTYANPLWWLVFILSGIVLALVPVFVHYHRNPPAKQDD